jgi:hypothetical protein
MQTNSNWFKIRSNADNTDCYITSKNKSPFETSSPVDIYIVGTTESIDESAEITFIRAENPSNEKSNDNYVLGTHLNTESFYCIKYVKHSYEVYYMKWDENIFEQLQLYGLMLNKAPNNDCPDGDEYLFRIVKEDNQKFVMIKNKKADRYISFYGNEYFALTSIQTNYDKKLSLVLSDNDNLAIKTYDRDSNHTKFYYLSESQLSKASFNIFMNLAADNLNKSVGFQFIRKEPVTKSNANIINSNFCNMLLLSNFLILLIFNSKFFCKL